MELKTENYFNYLIRSLDHTLSYLYGQNTVFILERQKMKCSSSLEDLQIVIWRGSGPGNTLRARRLNKDTSTSFNPLACRTLPVTNV